MKSSDVPFESNKLPSITERVFRERGENKYSLDLLPAGVELFVDRLRREHRELVGELSVKVNGSFPHARTVDGILSIADFNFSSSQARQTRAKLLAERSRVEGLDWYGFIEEFAIKILATERKGKPAVVLANVKVDRDKAQTWDVDSLPLLQTLPLVLFGDGDSMKSYLAMYLAGSLAQQGINVLYADWEFSEHAHADRLGRLFQPKPENVFYIRCQRPIGEEVERMSRLVQEHSIKYVVCDSMMFACDGKADEEQAGIYFRAVRQLGDLGTLHVAHTTKNEGESEKTVFGSIFFSNGARSIWMVCKASEHPQGEQYVGLYHRKANTNEQLKARGFKFSFRGDRTFVETLSVETIDELAARLPLLDRAKRALQSGAMTPKALADDLGIGLPLLWKLIARHGSVFSRMGPKVGLSSRELEF